MFEIAIGTPPTTPNPGTTNFRVVAVTPKVNARPPLTSTRVSASKPGPPTAAVSVTVSPGSPAVGVTPPVNDPATTVTTRVASSPSGSRPTPTAVRVTCPGAFPCTAPTGGGVTTLALAASLEVNVGAGSPV